MRKEKSNLWNELFVKSSKEDGTWRRWSNNVTGAFPLQPCSSVYVHNYRGAAGRGEALVPHRAPTARQHVKESAMRYSSSLKTSWNLTSTALPQKKCVHIHIKKGKKRSGVPIYFLFLTNHTTALSVLSVQKAAMMPTSPEKANVKSVTKGKARH